MKVLHTPDSLRNFEANVAAAFNAGAIKAPVHLSGGNELDVLEYFRTQVNEQDYVCTTWRSHYHCLCKGVPEEQLFADILAGKSITLNYPEQRVLSSAIVGGVVPIGLGIAWAIKHEPDTLVNYEGVPRIVLKPKVHVFIGDMTACSGIKYECAEYARAHGLPIQFIVEDNGMSVCTPTKDVLPDTHGYILSQMVGATWRYKYELPWPHSGAGKRVEF